MSVTDKGVTTVDVRHSLVTFCVSTLLQSRLTFLESVANTLRNLTIRFDNFTVIHLKRFVSEYTQ